MSSWRTARRNRRRCWPRPRGNFLEKTIGGLIPLTETALSPFLLTLVFFQLFTMPLLMAFVMPSKDKAVEISDANYAEFTRVAAQEEDVKSLRPAERWERSRILLTIIGVGILVWVIRFIAINGVAKLDLNRHQLHLLRPRPGSARLAAELHGLGEAGASATTFGVIIQFPLYAGIFGNDQLLRTGRDHHPLVPLDLHAGGPIAGS